MNELSTLTAGLFASIESLIGLAIFAILAVLSSALQKRQQKKQGGAGRPGPESGGGEWNWPEESSSDAGASATPASNWEEELKRLLGQAPVEPPPPPPIVVARPVPPPPIVVARPPAAPPPLHSAETHEYCPTLETEEPVVIAPALGRLDESRAALASAGRLEELVASRLEQVTQHRVEITRTQRRGSSSKEIAEVVSMFRSPRSARQAFVASQIFGVPRGLESPPR